MYAVSVVVLLGVIYGGVKLGAMVSYTLSYESRVKQTVCDMVKPEYLRDPCPALESL